MTGIQLAAVDFSTRLCITLLHSLWQAAALAAIAWLMSRLWRQRSVEWSYALNVCALGLTVACAAVTFAMTDRTQNAAAPMIDSRPHAAVEKPVESASLSPMSEVRVGDFTTSDKGLVPGPTEIPRGAAGGFNWAIPGARAAPLLAGLYATGVVLMFLRLAAGIIRAERLRSRSRLITDGPMFDSLRRLADAWSMRVVPALATAEHILAPKVVGLMKPTILMPASAISGLSPDQLEMLLLHELAHVRRHDLWINLLQRVAEAALFFNPAVWVLSRRIGSLREYCCDELACSRAAGHSKVSQVLYAQALLRVGELSQAVSQRRHSSTALAASGRSPSQLRRRIARLLGEPIRDSLQLSPGALLLPLSLGAALIMVQPGMITRAEHAPPRANNSAEASPEANESAEAAASSPPPDDATPMSTPATDADRIVAEARARTFGLQDVDRIAFKQLYRQSNELGGLEDAKADLASLWKARTIQVAESQLDSNRHIVLLTWDSDRLLLESFSSFQPKHSWRQTHYWDGQQGWIGETSAKPGEKSKNVYRYATLDKLTEHIMPFYHPQWAAAGDRLPWGGPTVLLREHGADPAQTRYEPAGEETIDGAICDVYDGPQRHERIWIERKARLVKAVSRHYVTDFSEEENWKVISEAAGRQFDDRQHYESWMKGLSEGERTAFNARWSAATWKLARPGNLTVFSDYREVAPGVRWPHQVDRVVVHPKGNQGGSQFYLANIVSEQIPEFNMDRLAVNALPEAGIKVTDRTGRMPFEYIWMDELDEAEVSRLREAKLAEKRAEEQQESMINATPIESVEDAIRILTEGPDVEPTRVWARAIKYLSEHPTEALPVLIVTLDREDRDHPMSKLAFALRAIGDPRAVPALIRALPRTLLPSRGDYGLQVKGDDLLSFMQQHDIDKGRGELFTYGRAFREVVGALRRITGQEFNEMELNWINLHGSKPHRRIARQQFERVARRWADWWEANWQKHVDDSAYSKVDLSETTTREGSPGAPTDLPTGPEIELIGVGTGGIIQSAHDTGRDCFFDLDTERLAGWPSELEALGKTRLDSPDLRDWARREGFDLVGVTYTPPGEEKPLYCLMPLDLRAWHITQDEHRTLKDVIRGKRPYPLSRPVDMLIPRRTIPKPWDPEHSGDSFLYVTREGTAGVLRLTAQITEAKDVSGRYSGTDYLFEQVGFHRGVKYVLTFISASTSEATAGEKPSEAKR